MNSLLKFFLTIILLLAVTSWHFRKQDQVNVADGKGWDGVTYHKMYLHYKGVASEAMYEAPFNKRIGLPWLAAQLPLDATRSFRFINLFSGLAACLLVYFALHPRVRGGVILVCLLPMAFFIYSPIRFPNFYPFTVDPPAMMLCALAALFCSRKYFVAAGLALVASAFFRESGIYFALALAFALALQDRCHRPAAGLICLIAVVGAVATSLLHLPGGDYSQFRTVMGSLKHKILEPLELLRAGICILMTLAPFLICKARDNRGAQAALDEQNMIGRCFLLTCMVMSFVGGGDTTRIFFIGYPLFVIMLAEWVSRADALTVALASSAGMIANRFHKLIPQPSATWPNHDVSGLFAITPDYAHPGIVVAFACYWAAWWFVIVGPGRSSLDAALNLQNWGKAAGSR
ncbi:MAG: hypothetical protein RJA48_1768 [Verrucomicrobiota bacterium]